jgi:hypothetical protein
MDESGKKPLLSPGSQGTQPAKKASGPLDWLPPLPLVMSPPRRDSFLYRTFSRLRPIHVWMGSIGSALVTAILIVGAGAYYGQRAGWFSRRTARSTSPTAPAAAPAAPATSVPIQPAAEPGAHLPHHEPLPGAKSSKAKTEGEKPHHRHAAETKTPAANELTKDDIIAAVKQNAPSLGICIVSARKQDKVPPGPTTLLVDFAVLPDGTVGSAELKAPEWVTKTSLPQCFNAKMLTWRFPPSGSGAPVKNMPLPVTF